MKYIRFQLPGTPRVTQEQYLLTAESVRKMAGNWINSQLDEWAEQRTIGYELHHRNEAIYVEFKDRANISMFFLEWKPKKHSTTWTRITVVEDILEAE